MINSYEFEIKKAKDAIDKLQPKTVIVQLPDGLKPYANNIVDELATKDVKIYIWAGSCFGACDIPLEKADLLIQFGHNEFK